MPVLMLILTDISTNSCLSQGVGRWPVLAIYKGSADDVIYISN